MARPRTPHGQIYHALVTVVETPSEGFVLEDATTGSLVDPIEFSIGGIPPVLHSHPAFPTVLADLIAANITHNISPRAAYGSRSKQPAKLGRSVSLKYLAAHAAALMLGLQPPSPNSLRRTVERYRRTAA